MKIRLDKLFSFYYVLMFFFIINSFYIIKPINSAMFSIVVLFIVLMLGNKKTRISQQSIKLMSYFYVVLLSVSLLTLLLSFVFKVIDLSYFKNMASHLIQSIIIFLFVHLGIRDEDLTDKNFFAKTITFAFVLQAVVSILAYSFDPVARIVHLTYTQDTIQRLYENYDGLRGLALTGSPAWGISIGYALTFLFATKYYLIDNKFKLKHSLVFLLLFVGAFFSGRSAFLGLIIAFFYFSVCGGKNRSKVFSLIFILFVLPLTAVTIMYWDIVYNLANVSFHYVFEPFLNLYWHGEFKSASTDRLMHMWQVDITEKEIIYGTGYFEDIYYGGHYREVDPGYLRNVLYGGLVWFIIICIYQFFPFFFLKKSKSFCFVLVIIMFVLEFKAMTIGFNKYMFTIALMFVAIEVKRYGIRVEHRIGKVIKN
ncbi:hypothetical protein [Vibrio alfacsensis]|uniref:hypothetical protein n=1 Tax=Vibrio alfacsensis TaxID=1074311 RepID=UPI00406931A2